MSAGVASCDRRRSALALERWAAPSLGCLLLRPGVFRCAPGAQMALGALLGEVGAAVQALNRPLVGRRGVGAPQGGDGEHGLDVAIGASQGNRVHRVGVPVADEGELPPLPGRPAAIRRQAAERARSQDRGNVADRGVV